MVHDLYYPYVGLENHARANNMRHRIGVWSEGRFSWLDDKTWEFNMDYAHRAQIGHITAKNSNLGVTLEFLDCVAVDDDAFLRNIHVINATGRKREIRLFMQQVFLISSTLTGDTAQYLPEENAILHFKGRRNFVVGGMTQDGKPFSQHSIGLFASEGKEGTFRDAEDGQLTPNEVEFGQVDSVIGFSADIGAFDSTHVQYWMALGSSQWDAIDLHHKINKQGLAPFFDATARHWHRWLSPAERFAEQIPEDWRPAFRKSALILKSHFDHKGGVIASTDTTMLNYQRDSYAYAWPRDGAYAIWPLIRMGYQTEAKLFFGFSTKVLHPQGFLMQKFRPDGSPGSTWHPYLYGNRLIPPIQEDETALVIFLLGEFITQFKDKDMLSIYYDTLVVPAANFMASYIDPATKLPHASYDLWEEKFLTTTYTTGVVYAALLAAVKMAELMQRPKDAVKWQTVAEEFPGAAQKLLYNPEREYFRKGFVNVADKGLQYDDTVDTSSFYGAFMFGLLPLESKQIKKSLATLTSIFSLSDDQPTVLPRYEHDQYYTVDPAGLGNPWFVTSLWLAEYDTQTGNTERAKKTIQWVKDRMLSTGVLSEQINPFSLAFTSVAPLAWSQAEFLSSILDLYSNKPKAGDHKE
jgi:GH15 family glucan-1,4-alpha-glucosidase